MSPQLVDNDSHGTEHLGLPSGWDIPLVVDENCIQQRRNKVFSYLVGRVNQVIAVQLLSKVSSTVCSKVPPSVTGDTFPKKVEVPILCLWGCSQLKLTDVSQTSLRLTSYNFTSSIIFYTLPEASSCDQQLNTKRSSSQFCLRSYLYKMHPLTICGSLDLLTQPEINFKVSLFTVLILLIKGCFVTISPGKF